MKPRVITQRPKKAGGGGAAAFMAKGDEMVFDMDGQKISGKAWGSPASGHNVLLLHGWLDNVGSWYPLAEELSQSGCYLVAIDLPGHGQSQVCGSTFPLLLK